MKVLFIHPKAPGQFSKLLEHYLSDDQNEVAVIHMGSEDLRKQYPAELARLLDYDVRALASLDLNQKPYLRGLDNFIRSATATANVAKRLLNNDWAPDVVYSHSGFGLGAFVHNIFPNAVYIKYCEWFYRNAEDGAEFFTGPRNIDGRVGTELLNGPILWDLTRADIMVAPTSWQRQQFPKHIRQSIHVVPDGIDASRLVPDPTAQFSAPSGRIFSKGDRVVTYVGRGADPFRGFKQFMDALGLLQAADPTLEAIIVGDQLTYYGPGPGTNVYFNSVMAEASIDPGRTHFTGPVSYNDFVNVLQVSAVHVYLTAPFVLSWSALEAMACGCAIVASNTEPIWEFIDDGEEGLLADFNDPHEIASRVSMMLDNEQLRANCGASARKRVIESWDLRAALAAHLELVQSALNSRPSVSIEQGSQGQISREITTG